MNNKRNFDVIFDLHYDEHIETSSTFLCESLSFKRSESFEPIPTNVFLSDLSKELKSFDGAAGFSNIHLVDMASYKTRVNSAPNENAFYKSVEDISRIRRAGSQLSQGVTICGKIALKDLKRETLLFKYWFGDDLSISLSSALWTDEFPETLIFLESLGVKIQLMFDITKQENDFFISTQTGKYDLAAVKRKIKSVSDAVKIPVDVHFCSIRSAGRANADVELLDVICNNVLGITSGCAIYSGGLKLEQHKLEAVARSYPEISRWCIGNDFLRQSVKSALHEIQAAEQALVENMKSKVNA